VKGRSQISTALSFFASALKFVGRPFYLIFSYGFIALILAISAVGILIKAIFSFPIRLFPKIPLKIKFKFRPKLLTTSVLGLAIILSIWFFVFRNLPSPKELVNRNLEVSTKIYDRNGVLLYKIYKNKNRTVVPLYRIPQNVRLATLAAEDAEFYSHPGISIRGIIRSIVTNLKQGELTGGSTITQQLVKNALLSPEKTFRRKLREVILAFEVELIYSKDQILEMYLNEVSYGGTAYGIQEAAQLYFGKDVENLDLAEAALLAGLPISPTKYSPFGSEPDLALVRQKEVLELMRINKYITQREMEEAENEPVSFAPNRTDIKAPHFVMYVKEQLVDKYGEEMVQQGGLNVITTLDYSIQKEAEDAVKNEVASLQALHVGNGAALVLNPKTGEILAMVGSKNYFDTEGGGNVNVTLRPRQPGSSIKIVNYAYALSTKYTPSSILSDTPVTFSTGGLPPYTPKNYDGKYRGNLSLRGALAESRNIPAVKVLASYGVSHMIELGTKMGITTWTEPSNYGLSLTLGGGEVKLLDLARVFGTIADYGKRPPIFSVIKVTNYKGRVLEENKCLTEEPCEGPEVVDPRVAFLLTDILKDNNARTPAFGTNSALVIAGHPEVAVKTGTSNDLKDNLTLGFTQKYLVAAWVGNNDSSPMSKIASGITGAAPIWHTIMASLLSNEKSDPWPVPDGVTKLSICTLTGTLSCEGCNSYPEWFLKEKAPTSACTKEAITKIKNQNKEGKILEPAAKTEVVN